MSNYCVWNKENDDTRIIIQVFNKCDLADVQKEFIEKGYVIEQVVYIGNDVGFMAIIKEMYE